MDVDDEVDSGDGLCFFKFSCILCRRSCRENTTDDREFGPV